MATRKICCAAVLSHATNLAGTVGELPVRHTFRLMTIAAAALAAGLCFAVPAARAAAGAEPWCIIDVEGNPHCNYRSSQECLAAIASGEHGFCNQNSSPAPSAAAAAPERGKRRAPRP